MGNAEILIDIVINEKAIEALAEVLSLIDDLKDLIPEWNKTEADQLEDQIREKLSNVLDSK